jgi:hypothetical protein
MGVRSSPLPLRAERRRPPATLARRLAARAGRIAAWTLGWTLFQWWAVLGWTDGGGMYAGLLFAGVLGLLGRDLGSRLAGVRAAPAPRAGVVIPLRPPVPAPPGEDAKAA